MTSANRCSDSSSVKRVAAPSTTDVVPAVPGVDAGRQATSARVLEVAGLLLVEAGAEVRRPVDPDADQGRDVRSPVGADRGQPVELGATRTASTAGQGVAARPGC